MSHMSARATPALQIGEREREREGEGDDTYDVNEEAWKVGHVCHGINLLDGDGCGSRRRKKERGRRKKDQNTKWTFERSKCNQSAICNPHTLRQRAFSQTIKDQMAQTLSLSLSSQSQSQSCLGCADLSWSPVTYHPNSFASDHDNKLEMACERWFWQRKSWSALARFAGCLSSVFRHARIATHSKGVEGEMHSVTRERKRESVCVCLCALMSFNQPRWNESVP